MKSTLLPILRWLGIGLVAVLVILAVIGLQREVTPEIIATEVTPSTASIGDRVELIVTVRLPWRGGLRGQPRFELPDAVETLGETTDAIRGIGIGSFNREVRVVVQAYAIGSYDSLGVQIPLQGEPSAVATTLPSLEIVPRLGESPDLSPELAPMPDADWLLAYRSAPLWIRVLIILGALIGIVLVILTLLVLRRRLLASRPAEPPWLLANRHLETLEAELPMEADPFFVRVTDILRQYIEAAFGFRATEHTTPEFLRDLESRKSALTPEEKTLLRELLTMGDRIKFARGDIGHQEMRKCLERARALVTESAARLQQPPEEDGAPVESAKEVA